MRYRDMLLNGHFTDTQRRKIVAIGNGIVRWLSGAAVGNYELDYKAAYLASSEKMTSAILETSYQDLKAKNRVFNTVACYMGAEEWLGQDFELWNFAAWEAFWLLRGTTALDVTHEFAQDSVAS